MIFECHHYLYPMYSKKKCSVLQKLLMGKVQVHTIYH